jgi:hypothetical protein
MKTYTQLIEELRYGTGPNPVTTGELDEVRTRSLTNPMKPAGKTEFAVAGVASGMFIKAFPTEKIARQYIKNTYSQKKKLRGKLGIVEVPLGANVVSNQMKRFGKIKVVKESVELDEASPKIKYAKIVKGIRDAQGPFSVVAIKNGKVVAQKNSIKNSKMLPIEVNDMADAHPGATISIESKGGKILNTFKESVEESAKVVTDPQLTLGLHKGRPAGHWLKNKSKDNTAAVAKQVKQVAKKYTKGKVTVRSKGGKTRFIMLSADNIDNKLRKMMLDVAYPKANIKDKSNIHYGNISDKIISASVEHWAKVLSL